MAQVALALRPLPETIPAGALAALEVSGDVLGLIGTGLLISQVQRSKTLLNLLSHVTEIFLLLASAPHP